MKKSELRQLIREELLSEINDKQYDKLKNMYDDSAEFDYVNFVGYLEDMLAASAAANKKDWETSKKALLSDIATAVKSLEKIRTAVGQLTYKENVYSHKG